MEINRAVAQAIVDAGEGWTGCMSAHTQTKMAAPAASRSRPLTKAAAELGIDLAASYMIGDALSDMAAGQRAGVKQAVLVLTGRGRAQRKKAAEVGSRAIPGEAAH